MLASALVLALAGTAAASPLAVPRYPETSISNGFHLMINVTDRSKDFHPTIQNTYIASIHVGAGLALVGNIQSPQNARVFYQNGTAEEHRNHRSTVITDSGTPPFPSGVRLVKDKGSQVVSTARLDAGPGSPGVGITAFPEPYAFLYPETWLACNESIPYYQGKHFIIFKQANSSVGKDGAVHRNVPAGCVSVRLLPQCTKLNDLPQGSYSSHDYAIKDRCYKDIKAIRWSDYGP